MQLSKNLTKATAVTLVLLVASIALCVISIQPTQAQATQNGDSQPLPAGVTPDNLVETIAYLSYRPNPVGVGQPILINIWINPSTTSGRRLMNYAVTLTKPDGTKDVKTMNSYYADSTAWLEYTPDQVGTWKIKFDFTEGYFPAGIIWDFRTSSYLSYNESVYYKPASTQEQTLIVQQNMVASWPPSALPTDYWTRPIMPENREWWSIAGDYPWYGPGGGPTWDELYPNTNPYWNQQQLFTPYVEGPNSAHIAWKKLEADAGIIGGQMGYYSWPVQFGGSYYNPPSIVFQGRIYQTRTEVSPTGPTGATYWQCLDIRTGEMIWERPLYAGESEPSAIEYGIGPGNVPGAEPRIDVPQLLSIGNGYLRKYDPFTGVLTLNASIAPLTGSGGTYYMNGYVLGIRDLGAAAGSQRYRLINWTTMGTSTNFTSRIISNTTYARNSLPTFIDWGVGLGATVTGISYEDANVGQLLAGFDLLTGQKLWEVTSDEVGFSTSADIADHGKLAILSAAGFYVAYDLRTGKLAWTGEKFEYPWGTFAGYTVQSAYGYIYRGTYAAFYAIDWDTGKIAWQYTEPALTPFESEMTGTNGTTVYPFRTPAMIADGKVFVFNQRQTPGNPIKRGWELHAINATTGEGIWKMINAGNSYNAPPRPMVISDGYLWMGSIDGYTYVYGKGKSSTTVTAPDVILPKGTGVVIKGTVLDQSPAQPGTPCVSKDSMSTQMEYLHKQMPIDGLWHNETISGVPVSLTAISSDGSFTDLGTVSTDGYYGTFSKTWTPDKEGDYQIIASFAGDDSYGSSAAATAISIGPASASNDTGHQETTVPDYTLTIVYAAIAIIIAVIISVAIVGIILYRKK
ncbi:MAG TPA: PQQ-binding-like beta-propeller repeat protein [Candidatus Sulfotelmatobacter sp.]|nr:PQQ-binding-like beta-propeller repeat protein [Candidatus Sulfotelmatobacter sp.]